ncbi:MAG: choice-of-anchor D domain-containing protein [Kofleriaceae bacterium]|nr:choice-of-anchor D domain-containing protein [Kofleriaceae bacterium]
MTTRRWAELALALLIITTSRIAGAAVTFTTSPVNAGNAPVATTTSPGGTGTLSSDTADHVDLVEGSCVGAGTGTFNVSVAGATTDIDLTTDKTVTVTYTPMTRGTRGCTINVVAAGTMTVLTTFTVQGTGLAPVISTNWGATQAFSPVRFNDAAATHTATLTLMITNNGDAGQALTINNISFSGGQAADYAVTTAIPFPANIAQSASQSWDITFDPAIAGPSMTTLVIDSNDPSAMMKNITLSGTGGTGVIGVTTPIAFGLVNQGATSPSSPIAVSNNGTGTKAALAVTQASFGSTNAAGWFKFNTTGCVLTTGPCALSMSLVGNTANLPIVCSPPPNASGTQNATITFSSDTDDATNNATAVSCTAGRADLVVTPPSGPPVAFGDQLRTTTSTSQSFQIANAGNIPLTYSVSLVGADASQFVLTGAAGCTSGCTVPATSMVNVGVQFRPTTTGDKSAALHVVAANDPDTPSIDIALTGRGVAPIATPSATTLAFADVDVGQTSAGQALTITNTGTSALTISAVAMTSGAADYVVTGMTGTGLNITVAPNATASWTIACKPTTMGARAGTIRFTHDNNVVAGSTTDVMLSCNGLQGQLAFISPPTPANSFNFGGVREGFSATQNFTLKNTGNAPVAMINTTTTGTGTGYSITAPTLPITTLAPNTSVVVTAQFAPANGNDGGQLIYNFTGTWGTSATTATAALTLNGDGLTTGYDTSPAAPNALDYGDVRFDQTKTMQVSIINTAGTTLRITGLAITPGTAQTGEFSLATCTHNSAAVTCPTSVANQFVSSGVNDTLVVNIVCDPNNRVAMLDAMLTVSSDLASNPTRNVPLRCNSNTAMLTLNPSSMVLDFGPTDLDATPVAVTRTVTITNTGTATLNLGAATKAGARYTFSTTPATAALVPNGTYSVDVTYTPTTEKPSNQPDTGTITLPVTGVFGAPATVTIQISGYGVDRHIAVAPAPTFPDTFRNPGDAAPTMPVTISNTGDATLSVSAVMLTNDPIWTIANPDPVTIPGQGTYDFNVKFSPMMAGKAPTGHMVIVNNDNGKPMVSIDLDANGIDRSIAFGPPVIDLGYVGIGLPVRLRDLAPNDLLGVQNADPTHTFKLVEVGIDGGDGMFVIEDIHGDPPRNIDLAPSQVETLDVVFTPNAEGDFTASASLYIDQDPLPQATVVLKGRGLYVDAGGGGGCSTGRGSGAGMLLVLGVLLGVGRKRRLRALAGAVGSLVGLHAASADPTRNLSLTVFDPTPSTTGNAFQLQSASVGESGDFAVSALASYASDPLVLNTVQNDDAAVKNRTMLSLGFAYAFGGRFEASARMPLYMQSGDALGDQTTMFGVPPASGTARGDATLNAKMQLGAADGGSLTFGFAGALTLPTATKDEFAGTEKPQGRVLFLLTRAQPRLSTSFNVGGIIRGKERFANVTQRSGVTWGASASFRALDSLWLGAEIYGDSIPGGRSAKPQSGEAMGEAQIMNTIEALGGIHYKMSSAATLGLAAGRGITSGFGSPAFRGVLTLSVTPGAPALRPIHPPRPPEPPKDSDGDGIKDDLDSCPNEPEDKDLFDDADGCPDLDNDADGVADEKDKCPLDAEDVDRFQDDDGCPDKDNDGDLIPDDKDKCPLVAEDKDGYQDQDGCPDPDNDGDGILDNADKCPREPETINGNADDDGCPDRGDALVVVSPDRLDLLDSIQFSSGSKLAKSSTNILGQIGATLRAHPEILRVRLTAHVNPSSDPKRDKDLSEARAKEVREWLVDYGIEPLRLQVAGFGGTKPLVSSTTRGAKEINDRIELIILERK